MDFIIEYNKKYEFNNSSAKLVQLAFNAINQRLKYIP